MVVVLAVGLGQRLTLHGALPSSWYPGVASLAVTAAVLLALGAVAAISLLVTVANDSAGAGRPGLLGSIARWVRNAYAKPWARHAFTIAWTGVAIVVAVWGVRELGAAWGWIGDLPRALTYGLAIAAVTTLVVPFRPAHPSSSRA